MLYFNNPKKQVTIIFIITFLLFLLTSCKVKHKTVERQKESISLDKIEKVSKVENKDISIDSSFTLKSEHLKLSKNTSIKLTQANENKTITIEDETGKKLTITGADAFIENIESKEVKKDSSVANVLVNDNSKASINKKTTTDFNNNSTSRSTDSKSIGVPFWVWIILILIGVVVVGRWIKKKHPLI